MTSNIQIPPFNDEAEQGLLGCLLNDNGIFFDVFGTVKAEDFYIPAHADIFTKIHEAIDQGQQASPVSLRNHFTNHPDLAAIGGARYLADLAGAVVSNINAPDYAALIADLSERRRLLVGLSAIREELTYSSLSARPARELRADMISLAQTFDRETSEKSAHELHLEILKDYELPQVFSPTGLEMLDKAMAGGLYPGFTYGIAGQEKRGKTTLANTISYNLNESGVKHAYFALEMGAKQIAARNLARKAQVNPVSFLYRNPTSMQKIAREVHEIPNNITYLDMPGCTFEQLKAQVIRLALKRQVKGWILDYWQLVGGQTKGQSTSEHLYEVAQWCANFSRKHGLWCILVAQVNRSGETYGSGGIDKACDQLYYIEPAEGGLYLAMKRSRYTPMVDIGDPLNPRYQINDKGPYFEEI